MGLFKRILEMESCNGLFKYPFGMSNKKKREVLDGLISATEISMKKNKCDICGKRLIGKYNHWGMEDFTSALCMLCHMKHFKLKPEDYILKEEQEVARLRLKGERK